MDLLLIFISGVFTALGPCVFTVLPVVFTYTFGISESKREAFIISLFFVLGFSIVFSILGAISSVFGMLFGIYKLKYIAGILAVALGLLIIFKKGFSFRLKGNFFNKFITKISNKSISFKYKVFTSIILGISYGVGANVCADPILAGILTYVSTKSDITFGILALFIYSMGYGLPIILLSIMGVEGKEIFEKFTSSSIVNFISGLILVLLGLFIIFMS
ncbi:cytochrome c biogenesis CcdA family protein [Methanothermococcus sp. SCGC AD-155-C09]|nr:cytochrome c biogenesis CcdA family protein [Methanothermococcus sp. SCGC AD-155-C09]